MGVVDSFTNLRNVTFTTFLPNVSFTTAHSLSDNKNDNINVSLVWSMLPTLIYTGMLMTTGLVGNTLVFVVYYKRFKPNPTRTYILAMSICDLLSNSIFLPGDILEIRYFYTFDMPELCKFNKFMESFLSLTSSFILVSVAIDRHHKICRPFKKQCIKYPTVAAIAGSTVAAFIYTIPYVILNGRQIVDTGIANVTGVMCTVDDAYVNSAFITVYYALTLVTFVICVIILVVCYTRIARKLWVHKKQTTKVIGTAAVNSSNDCYVHERSNNTEQNSSRQSGGQGASLKRSSDTSSSRRFDNKIFVLQVRSADTIIQSEVNKERFEQSFMSVLSDKEQRHTTSELESDFKDFGDGDSTQYSSVTASYEEKVIHTSFPHTHYNSNPTMTSQKRSKIPKPKQKCSPSKLGPVKKIPSSTTFMMLVLTIVFVINYLPYLTIALATMGRHVSRGSLSYVVFNLHQIGVRSYFINCAVNPVVYSFCSAKFRHECRHLMRGIGE